MWPLSGGLTVRLGSLHSRPPQVSVFIHQWVFVAQNNLPEQHPTLFLK